VKLADLPVRVVKCGSTSEKRGPKTTPELSRIRKQRRQVAWRAAQQKKPA
jgi:hypothetical protein